MKKYEQLQQLLEKMHGDILRVIVQSESLTIQDRESLRRIAEDILDASQTLGDPPDKSSMTRLFQLLKQIIPFLGGTDVD